MINLHNYETLPFLSWVNSTLPGARRRQTELARQNERLLGGVNAGEIFLATLFASGKLTYPDHPWCWYIYL